MRQHSTGNLHGFTIVELLIVIVVVGILAAISIVAYTGIQNSVYDNIVQQDLSNVSKSLEMYKAEKDRYPQSQEFPANLKLSRNAYSITVNHVNYITDPEGSKYALGVVSKSSKRFLLTSGTGVTNPTDVSAHQTAAAIDLTWDSPNPRRQGFTFTTSAGWNSSWTFVAP